MKSLQALLVIGLLGIPIHCFAQQDSLKLNNEYFAGVGIAVGTGSHEGAFVSANLQVQQFTTYLSVKISGFVDLNFMANESLPSIGEGSLLLGKSYPIRKAYNLQIGTGLSLVEYASRGALLPCKSCGFLESPKYETNSDVTLGLPLEVKFNIYFKRSGAFSLSLNGNVNAKESFFGVAVGLLSGRLRPTPKN